MDDTEDFVIIADYTAFNPSVGSRSSDLAQMAMPVRSKTPGDPLPDDKQSPVLMPQDPEVTTASEKPRSCDQSFDAYEDDKSVCDDNKDSQLNDEEQGLKSSTLSDNPSIRKEESIKDLRDSEGNTQLDDGLYQADQRRSSPTSEPPKRHSEEPWVAPPPPPPPPPPHPMTFQNPPPPPPLHNRGAFYRPNAAACLPPPPPPPPPQSQMAYHDGLSPTCVPPPPPPPPPSTTMIAQAGRRRRGINELEVVESATQLRPCFAPDNNNNNAMNGGPIPLPLERVVRLPTGGPVRRAALTHHTATPFDLNNYMWLLRHGEPDVWYAHPSYAELKRIRRLEAAGLADEIPALLPSGKTTTTTTTTTPRCTTTTAPMRPAPADTVRVHVGAVMGVHQNRPAYCWCLPLGEGPADAQCPAGGAELCDARCRRAVENAFLTYYMVVEAPRSVMAEDDAAFDAYGSYPPPPPPPPPSRPPQYAAGSRGEEVVYRLERVGSRDACVARAYHNAALKGWSTVFCCVVRGDVEMGEVRTPGLEGFERVGGLAALVADSYGEDGKVRVFY